MELTRSQQEFTRQIENQRQRFRWSLSQTQAFLQTLDATLGELPQQVNQLRQDNHPYDPDLEDVHGLVDQWQQQRPAIVKQVEEGGGRLESTYRMIKTFDTASSQWLTEFQITDALQGELRDVEDMVAQTLRWQKQILSDLSPYTQRAANLGRVVKTRLAARDFLQSATFLCDPPEVPMGAFSLICPHWGPSEQVPVYLFISDQRIVLESQQTEGQKGVGRFGHYEAARERKLLQQWPIAALTQIERDQSSSTEDTTAAIRELLTLHFDESHADVLVEQLQVSSEAREAAIITDTLYRAQHPRTLRSPSQGRAVGQEKPQAAPDSPQSQWGLSAAEIEQKLQKIEDALLDGRISEQTYRELKQKYEDMA